MDELEWRIHTRMAFRELFGLNRDGISIGLDRVRTVHGMVWQFLSGRVDYAKWNATPWQDQALILWHERCRLAWLWICNETAILDLRIAAPIQQLADRIDNTRRPS